MAWEGERGNARGADALQENGAFRMPELCIIISIICRSITGCSICHEVSKQNVIVYAWSGAPAGGVSLSFEKNFHSTRTCVLPVAYIKYGDSGLDDVLGAYNVDRTDDNVAIKARMSTDRMR